MEIIIIAILGACLGSFVTAASYRLPKDEDIIFAPSKCPKCNAKLKSRDLVPILSWLINKAKCRSCGVKISARYVLTEVLMMLIALGLYLQFGATLDFLLFLLLATVLMVTIVADFETYIMPDSMTISAFILGIVRIYFLQLDWRPYLMGFFACLLIALVLKYGYQIIKKKDGLGMGDVKFLPVAGLWLGLELLPIYFVLAGIFGIITAIIWKRIYNNPEFPFGPALAIAMFLLCVFEDTIKIVTGI